jgi:hypothetical protein
MSTATTDINIETVANEARERLIELREQRRRLSLDALGGDAQQQQALADVESQIAAAERQLEQAGLAGEEQTRREREAAEQAAQTAREQAARRAAKLQGQLPKSEQSIDAAMATLAGALAAHEDLTRRLAHELRDAGHDRPRVALEQRRAQLAFAYHLGAAGQHRALGELDLPMQARPEPLVRAEASNA